MIVGCCTTTRAWACLLICLLGMTHSPCCQGYGSIVLPQRTLFTGSAVRSTPSSSSSSPLAPSCRSWWTMRKQKASDRRTRRKQRGQLSEAEAAAAASTPSSLLTVQQPMRHAVWKHKTGLVSASQTIVDNNRRRGSSTRRATTQQQQSPLNHSTPSVSRGSSRSYPVTPETIAIAASGSGGGRGRSRKRTTTYQSLQHYHTHFVSLLQSEYQAEEAQVLGRIAQANHENDPLGLEVAGYAAFDMVVERRGNVFCMDEVYRLTKATDAVVPELPGTHKFRRNDVIVLTQQPHGAGDFFAVSPVTEGAITMDARVMNTGRHHLDIAVAAGQLEASFGCVAGNDRSGRGNRALRLRVDKFVSNVSYQRMLAALSQLTSVVVVPDRGTAVTTTKRANSALTSASESSSRSKRSGGSGVPRSNKRSTVDTEPAVPEIHMDKVLKEAILQTHAFTDETSLLRGDRDVCNMEDLSFRLAKPPMANSQKLARTVLSHIQSSRTFCHFNSPQMAAIEAALTRRMTMIQGPPGTGKTVTAAAIAFGFVAQCKTVSPHTKVLCTAFSNVGADNLAERILQTGLDVVRVGKASAVTESLWGCTLDAAIDRDPIAQKALKDAAKATAQLSKTKPLQERTVRDAATTAVKAAIRAANVAATIALRDADVIVATSTGAADPRLLAACGIVTSDEDEAVGSGGGGGRTIAPDGQPPLSLPFVLIDEACQSVEPASLIPIVATDSCRSLVLLGDPCQLPPTVMSREASSLSLSLMERLAMALPHPIVIPPADTTPKDIRYLNSLPVKQSMSLVRSRSRGAQQRSYRKIYSGSLLLSIQYRMHPSIAALPSALFYDGLLASPVNLPRSFPRSLNKLYPCRLENNLNDLCVRVFNVGGRDNERQGVQSKFTRTVYTRTSTTTNSPIEQQTTYWNQAEADRVMVLVKTVVSDGGESSPCSIGIISPYTGQVALIQSMIQQDSALNEKLAKRSISMEVKTVDGYQGRERDIVIFSAVRSNRQDRIGFLRDWRRMNVALTRAKSALLVVGDLETLSSADKHWDAFRKWSTGVGCIVEDTM